MDNNNFHSPPKRVRDNAVDFVKFLAVFLVLNSHMGACYPKYSFLAVGGAIGDSLFFFVSGFTLFLGKGEETFLEWYKRRIKRILPSLLSVAIIGLLVFERNDTFGDVIIAKRYWFIQCIFVLYPFLYLTKKYVSHHRILLCVLTVIVLTLFHFVNEGNRLFWGEGYYRWTVYLLFMLLGAIMGMSREKILQISLGLALLLTLFCIAVWYGIVYLFGKSSLQVFSILPMMGVAIFTYCMGSSKPFEKLMNSRRVGPIIIAIGALCLESYLIQTMIITNKLNDIFPFNIPIIIISVLIAAYMAKLLATIIVQIFDSQPINWKTVLRIY